MGASVGKSDPFTQAPPEGGIDGGVSQDPDMPALIAVPDLHRGQCTLDGVKFDCGRLQMLSDID
jgi:hypothetical protein